MKLLQFVRRRQTGAQPQYAECDPRSPEFLQWARTQRHTLYLQLAEKKFRELVAAGELTQKEAQWYMDEMRATLAKAEQRSPMVT